MKFEKIIKDNIEIASSIFMECFNASPWFEKWTMESSITRLSQIVINENDFGVLVYIKDLPCAIIIGREEDYYDGVRCFIKELCVTSSMQGSGIGSKILKYYIDELKKKEIVHISLHTLRDPRIVNFYQKAGFKEREHLIMLELLEAT